LDVVVCEYFFINCVFNKVGNILAITTGDIIPADGKCTHSNDLQIDEVSMTGESGLIKKVLDIDPFLLCVTFYLLICVIIIII
jgi:magnesium-transporting ATPase (P-type)